MGSVVTCLAYLELPNSILIKNQKNSRIILIFPDIPPLAKCAAPREVNENSKDIRPRSYLSDEPTVARELQHDFEPVAQFDDRG